MKKQALMLSFMVCICVSNACQPSKTDDKVESLRNPIQQIDALFKAQHRQGLFHGGVVISHHGGHIYENYLGIADYYWHNKS